ncbi:MAG: hypothetical protein HC849_28985 [Oscillatoriales cyanobacterium RU_3_3]|nr:hypothetical protein [Microcoleus sp. SU_5_6]NJL67106.1 hypothetical protein [Microcoleus sp. SM1_3_4]NJM63297.1 hypothetical protein [Oscillatoriales cyanobacterium RU_3_3]
MTPEEITNSLQNLFGESVETQDSTSWQVETDRFRLLVLLSEDRSWLRILLPIASAAEAQPFFDKMLEANFDTTLETRYALHQNILWGVFQHSSATLAAADFAAVITRLLDLHQRGLSEFWDNLIENRIRQIIKAAKIQGQSVESTLQTLERFYAEGMMGEMELGRESREQTLAAWRFQLERLWPEVEP